MEIKLAGLFGISLLVVGCASLSDAGAKVYLTTDPTQIKGCRKLGPVTATPPYGLPSDWEKKLRNAAGAMGANWVLSEKPGASSTVKGEAYSCPQKP